MLNGVFFVCLSLGLFSAGCSLNCDWMDHKFRQYSGLSLYLLNMMANEDAAAVATVAFPDHLYNQQSMRSAEDKLAFTVQILKETASLFEEDSSAASWDENIMDNFVNVITQQADSLQACIGSHMRNTKLQIYFGRLSQNILRRMGHSAEAWEQIRKEVKVHLMRIDLLLSPLIRTD